MIRTIMENSKEGFEHQLLLNTNTDPSKPFFVITAGRTSGTTAVAYTGTSAVFAVGGYGATSYPYTVDVKVPM